MDSTTARRNARIGFEFVHSLVDDHSRYAYSEILPDEQGPTTAGFLARAFDHFASVGISVERLMSDNHWSYSDSREFAEVLAVRGIRHVSIKPHCPWQNGKVERFNKIRQTEWAYRYPFTSNRRKGRSPSPHSSTSTTISFTTAHSENKPQSAECHQPDGRVHLVTSGCGIPVLAVLRSHGARHPLNTSISNRVAGHQYQPTQALWSESPC